MTTPLNLKSIIEALLLSSDEPLSADKLHKIISNKQEITKADVLDAIQLLENEYQSKEIKITKVANPHQPIVRSIP